MKREELAKLLDGREYGSEITKIEEKQAKENKLVVVFGASDDLMELRGAIREEFGTGASFDKNGKEIERCHDNCIHYQNALANANHIEADYSGEGWIYKTKIPHVTFKIMEGKDLYCTGMVFYLEDLK